MSENSYFTFYKIKENFLNLCEKSYNNTSGNHSQEKFRLMTIRYKLGCPYFIHCQIGFSHIPVNLSFYEENCGKLPEPNDVFSYDCACSNCQPKCEICGKELSIKKIRTHHLAYIPEAVPTDDNLDWLQYYQLLCYECHSKKMGKVKGYKDWLKIVRAELVRRGMTKIKW